jgi:alpha-tubulin suppressor-like RCC1 family protein
MIQRKNGYSLVLIILMSTFILALLAGAMRVVTQSYIYSQEEYYYKLAQEAGEAGTAYANACLDANGAEQSWSSVPGGIGPLRPETNCKGAVTFPGNRYVFENSKLRTTFEVGDLEASTKGASSGVALSAATAQISSTGRVEITNGSGTVLKTYTAVVKKSVTWPADIDATRIVSGTYRTCAILSNNVWCWGSNDKYKNKEYTMGQLGDGTTVSSNVPVKVRSVGDMRNGKIIDIFAAQFHSCVLTEFNSVRKIYCWGNNKFGQLGNGDFGDGKYSSVPVEVKPPTGALAADFAGNNISAIGGTGDVSCAIAAGKVYCWGSNDMGQLGYGVPGNPKFSATPVRINSGGHPDRLPNNYSATKLSTGGSRSQTMCVITTEKRAYCWGQARYGQLGIGATHYSSYGNATRVKDLAKVTDISQDGYNWSGSPDYVTHTCAVADGKVYCWGGAGRGQAGSPGSGNPIKKHIKPELVGGLPGVALQVEVGISHSCALMDDAGTKKVYCWGNNEMGQLGANREYKDPPDGIKWTYKPMQVKDGLPAGEKIVSLSAGANRGCVIMENKRSYCWGLNNEGQIGDGTNENRFSPTESLFLRPVQNRYIY